MTAETSPPQKVILRSISVTLPEYQLLGVGSTPEAGTRFALKPLLGTLRLLRWGWILALEECSNTWRHVRNGRTEALGFRHRC